MTSPIYPLHNGVDASRPGGPLPTGTEILAAYVGEPFEPGPPDTPHIWTAAEWNEYLTVDKDLRVLPIYTHNFPGNATEDAKNAVDAVRALGWLPNLTGTSRRIIALDLELFEDPSYVSALGAGIEALGFDWMPYNTNSTAFANPEGPVGHWVADLVMRAPKSLGPGVAGVQYKFGTQWDYNVFSDRVYLGCGIGLRHG